RTVVQHNTHVVDRIAGEHTARERFLDAFVDRLDVFLRNRALRDLVLEDVAGARFAREQVNLRVTVLAATAGLLRVLHLAVSRTGERFLVRDLWLADARFDAELTLQAVDDDLEVELAHARDNDLPCLLVGLDAERRVLGHQLLQTDTKFLLIALRLWLNG